MIRVVFRTSYRMYNAGERAGFDDQEARALVEQGIAKVYEEDAGELDIRPVDERVDPVSLQAVSASDPSIDERVFDVLREANIATAQDILTATVDELVGLKRIGIATARRLLTAAQTAISAAEG